MTRKKKKESGDVWMIDASVNNGLCGQPVLLGSEGAVVTWLSVRPIYQRLDPGSQGCVQPQIRSPNAPNWGFYL